MKSASKVQLSAYEMELVLDPGIILTKNSVLQKTKQLLAQLLVKQQQFLDAKKNLLSQEITGSTPKISRGEHYKGLPYLVLDYPRLFGTADILAIRTLFWWGHFFSTTLQVAGAYKTGLEEKLIRALPLLKEEGFWFCVGTDPWEHDFGPDNYVPMAEINTIDLTNLIRERPFIKIAHKAPLHQWEEAEDLLLLQFKTLITIIC
jgi:hypothetical protein